MDSDPSLVATFRIVLLFIKADGELHPKEVAWFKQMVDRYIDSEADREILYGDFEREIPLENLVLDLEKGDGARLLSWAGLVCRVDGKFSKQERFLYEQLKDLLHLESGVPSTVDPKLLLAEQLVAADNRRQMWKELGEAGSHFRKPVSLTQALFPGFVEIDFYRSNNRFVVWFALAILFIIAAVQLFYVG